MGPSEAASRRSPRVRSRPTRMFRKKATVPLLEGRLPGRGEGSPGSSLRYAEERIEKEGMDRKASRRERIPDPRRRFCTLVFYPPGARKQEREAGKGDGRAGKLG